MSNKLYVVGGSIGYANWMIPLGCSITHDKNEADIFVFTGGADLDPLLYGEPIGQHTYHNPSRSREEKNFFDFAVENGKKMWGTCLGCQTIGVLGIPNAKLIQHMSHPGRHEIILPYHNEVINVPSMHHQMLYVPEDQEGKDYLRVAYAKKLSPFHYDGYNKDYEFDDNYKEIEGIYIPSIKALAFQTHFEVLGLDHPSIKVAQELFCEFLLN